MVVGPYINNALLQYTIQITMVGIILSSLLYICESYKLWYHIMIFNITFFSFLSGNSACVCA